MTELSLRTAIGNYGHTALLKDGTIRSQMFEMEHKEISPVPMIFRRMVRALETFVDFNVAQGIIPDRRPRRPVPDRDARVSQSHY